MGKSDPLKGWPLPIQLILVIGGFLLMAVILELLLGFLPESWWFDCYETGRC